ncbi:hypothetical protein VNO77_39074 [Canavalia gladiata]|uniref:Uncharacterized protein n=1 Tax=Canavalia gladiata TaxID=3824 RepID=A0AAN9KAE8_CANGL
MNALTRSVHTSTSSSTISLSTKKRGYGGIKMERKPLDAEVQRSVTQRDGRSLEFPERSLRSSSPKKFSKARANSPKLSHPKKPLFFLPSTYL